MTMINAPLTQDANPSAPRSEACRMSHRPSLRFRRSLFCLLVSLVVAGLPGAPSRADVPSPPVTTPNAKGLPDSEGYVADNRPATMSNAEEGIPAGPLVAAAYGFIWAAVLVFVGLTARRTRQLETEIAELAARLPGAKTSSPG